MTAAIPDLWPPDVVGPPSVTTLAVLKQQAVNLGTKTQNLVTATVDSRQLQGNLFEHTFVVHAPILGYRVPLFHVRHGIEPCPIELWPSDVLNGRDGGRGSSVWPPVGYYKEDDREGFLGRLKELLNSERVLRIVQSLAAQSASGEAVE